MKQRRWCFNGNTRQHEIRIMMHLYYCRQHLIIFDHHTFETFEERHRNNIIRITQQRTTSPRFQSLNWSHRIPLWSSDRFGDFFRLNLRLCSFPPRLHRRGPACVGGASLVPTPGLRFGLTSSHSYIPSLKLTANAPANGGPLEKEIPIQNHHF